MIRRIIRIDKEKCNGCGACADACHEGAIDIINGKAENISVTDWEIVSRNAPQERFLLKKEKRRNTMKRLSKKRRKKYLPKTRQYLHTLAVPDLGSCRSSGQKHPKQINHLQQGLRYQGSRTGRYRSNWRPFMRPILTVRSS